VIEKLAEHRGGFGHERRSATEKTIPFVSQQVERLETQGEFIVLFLRQIESTGDRA
jgi:hypothetical protein